MKILIISDSHSFSNLLYEVFDKESPDMVIHLGDLEDSPDDVARRLGVPKIPCVFIKGNCDYDPYGKLLKSSVFSLKGHRFFCAHGHIQGVNYGLDRLVYSAQEEGCYIALYGHTHRPFDEFLDGGFGGAKIHVINPGSIALPRGGSEQSYVIMNMTDDGAYDIEFRNL